MQITVVLCVHVYKETYHLQLEKNIKHERLFYFVGKVTVFCFLGNNFYQVYLCVLRLRYNNKKASDSQEFYISQLKMVILNLFTFIVTQIKFHTFLTIIYKGINE